MIKVKLEGIMKVFGNTTAVAKTDLEISDGEFLILVGPSGCGKTTTLRMIAGLEMPTEGEIYIGDRKVTNLEPKDRDIAMVFQNYALYPHMKVYDNMAFGLRLRKIHKEEIDARVKDAADILGIIHLLDRYPKQLSGGQRQRVAVGRAIVRHPQVFLMDEPLSNLDAKLRVQMRAELIKLHKRLKTTIIYVTHDQTEAMTMGTYIAVMKDGLIQQIGTPKEIYHNPGNIFVAGFIGSPPINFLKGVIEQHNAKIQFRKQDFTLDLPTTKIETSISKEFLLGIRPESLAIVNSAEDGSYIPCEVDVVENVGSENIIHTHTQSGEEVVIKASGFDKTPQVGTVIKAIINRGNIHVFDPENDSSLLVTFSIGD